MNSHREDADTLTLWLDTALLLLCGFVLLAILLVLLANDPQKKKTEDATKQPESQIQFAIRWPDHMDADIDLWTIAPGDVPVGYSSKQGRTLNLIRDNLGNINTLNGLRQELTIGYDVPAGTYCLNVVAYHVSTVNLFPIKVSWSAEVRSDDTYHLMKTVAEGEVVLSHTGEEITAVCFDLDAKREVIPNSANHVYHRIWAGAQ